MNKFLRMTLAVLLTISLALGSLTNFHDVKKVEAATHSMNM